MLFKMAGCCNTESISYRSSKLGTNKAINKFLVSLETNFFNSIFFSLIYPLISSKVRALNGADPCIISNNIIPKHQISTLLVWYFWLTISGGIYSYVPQTVVRTWLSPIWQDHPKSHSLTLNESSRRIFSGLRSQWTIF